MAGHYFNTVIDAETGKPVSGAVVKVYTSAAVISGNGVSSGSFETIFSDDGVTSVDQAGGSYVTTNSRGFFEFWTDADQVVYEVLFAGTALFAVSDVEVYDGGDATDLTGVTTRLDNLDALLGTSANDTTLGTFTGSIITDNVTVSAALQELETDLTYGGVAAGDPGADAIPVWDDTAGAMEWSTVLYTDEDAERVLVGNNSALGFEVLAAGITPALQVQGTASNDSSLGLARFTNGTTSPFFFLGKSRGATIGDYTIVASGDYMGAITFNGADGSTFTEGGRITCEVDGTPGLDDMPGRLVFYTTADGAAAPTERMRINKDGNVGIGTSSPSQKLDVVGRAEVSISTAGSSGASANPSGDALFLEAGFETGLSIGTPNTVGGNIFFCDPQASNVGRIRYDHANNSMDFYTNASERASISSSGALTVGSIDVLTESLVLACSDESTAITTTGTKLTFRIPFAMTVTGVRASLGSACTTGTFTVDINEGGTSILSTKLTIDATEKTSTTAATAAVISDSALADDAEITIDVDNVGDSTATGLKVTLIGTRA